MESLFDLFLVASMPILKVLLITVLGLLLAINRIDVLGETATNHLNKLVFFVFGPALVASNLAKTVTFKTFITLWFMLPNVLLTFVLGSAMGWVLGKVAKAPKHVRGLISASCSAGNLGNMPIIILPAMCKEKDSPFGAGDVCERYGLAYASLSMAAATGYFWLYAYNVVRISSKEVIRNAETVPESPTMPSCSDDFLEAPSLTNSDRAAHIKVSSSWIKKRLRNVSKEIDLKAVLAPSTVGAIVGFFIGMISPLGKLLMDDNGLLHIVGDTSFMIGDVAIPSTTLIQGANLLRGLRGSVEIHYSIVLGIIAIRYIFLPVLGILIVKGAVVAGLVKSKDLFFQFALLLQYTVPPAASISTVTELFGAGQKECSVIMLWTYVLAPLALTLWSTLFLCLLS